MRMLVENSRCKEIEENERGRKEKVDGQAEFWIRNLYFMTRINDRVQCSITLDQLSRSLHLKTIVGSHLSKHRKALETFSFYHPHALLKTSSITSASALPKTLNASLPMVPVATFAFGFGDRF